MPQYTQREFDSKLLQMLQEAQNEGKQSCRIVSKDLHKRVVMKPKINRMPMACKAMWKLWEQQGNHRDRIIHTMPSNQASTIEIEFNTSLGRNPKNKNITHHVSKFSDDITDETEDEKSNGENMFQNLIPEKKIGVSVLIFFMLSLGLTYFGSDILSRLGWVLLIPASIIFIGIWASILGWLLLISALLLVCGLLFGGVICVIVGAYFYIVSGESGWWILIGFVLLLLGIFVFYAIDEITKDTW